MQKVVYMDPNSKKRTNHIMIVEDDDENRELIAFALGKKGYEVVCYDNAITALDNLPKDQVDIIIYLLSY